jgi:hypothetical protein
MAKKLESVDRYKRVLGVIAKWGIDMLNVSKELYYGSDNMDGDYDVPGPTE